tara:strand:- start:94839 stop:96251 length:1413 start_codon:yes stop_codon:yes gene_type:complete
MTTKKTVHAFSDDVLADHDAVALAGLIKSGEVSVEDVSAAAAVRINKIHQQLNVLALPLFDSVRPLSASLDGVFAGVPTLIKDNTDIVGVPTGHGSDAVRAVPAKADGAFTQQYNSLGFNVLGKSTLPEFGFNATTEFANAPPTRNPWNPNFSSGASSGGSAALVAAGAVPIAHANDGGGSIRIPAACCGLVGLKPTRGRLVDAEQNRKLPINIVAEGVVTRSVRDTAMFYFGAEQYYRSPKLPSIGLVEGPAKRRLRIGLVIDSITGHETCEQTRAVVEETAGLLEGLGHEVSLMPLPVRPSFAQDFTLYWAMLAFSVSKMGGSLFGPGFDAKKLDGLSLGLAKRFKQQFYKAPAVLYRLHKTHAQYASVFSSYDAVLSPVLAHTTPELGYLSPNIPFDELIDRLLRYVSFTPLNNASGSPAISLPMGMSDNGLPIGVQLSAVQGGERQLLELAFELEHAKPWQRIQDY